MTFKGYSVLAVVSAVLGVASLALAVAGGVTANEQIIMVALSFGLVSITSAVLSALDG